jgi:DNA-binding PadR family transcriptional regulator
VSGLDSYERKLLDGWEEVFKRGQLSFWILLSLREGPKAMADVRSWMTDITDGGVTVEDRSLYRALQRFQETELVTSTAVASSKGPDRKLYELSAVGERVLSAFIERNVRLFLRPEVVSLLNAAK